LLWGAACRTGDMIPNRPEVAAGPSYDVAFQLAIDALSRKGYTVQSQNLEDGTIVTAPREGIDFTWYITAEVQTSGIVSFYAVGSQEVMSGGRIDRRVQSYALRVKRVFEKLVIAHSRR
ncbi:MAG: hypothetical protein ACYS22_22055, partial [Planctomycetota bacterium]